MNPSLSTNFWDHFSCNLKEYRFISLARLNRFNPELNVTSLPYCLRIILESNLRHCQNDLEVFKVLNLFSDWQESAKRGESISIYPTRVLLQDYTGIPVLVDLCSLRQVAIEELGIKGFYYEPWYGFLAPAGTPDADLDKLSAIIVDAANAPEMTKKLTSDGIEVRPLTRQKFIPVFNADIKKWSEVIKALGIKSNN